MDPHSILDNRTSQEPAPAESLERGWPGTGADQPPVPGDLRFPGEDGGKSLAEMAQKDLAATLQLLAERAQYITGATGAAIALSDREQMVCRASAGTSAPEVGAQLQVNSGLSGESIRTQQTLRCDDASSDPRVNRESCQALGIASVVVMPLLNGNDVIGVFELFSDKPNIFEARDITALERMGSMVFTALEHAIAAQGLLPEPEVAGAMADESESGRVPGAVPTTFAESAHTPEAVPLFDRKVGKADESASSAGAARTPSGVVFHRRVPPVIPPFVAPKMAPSIAPTTEVQADAPAPVEDEDILSEVHQGWTAPSRETAAMVPGIPGAIVTTAETAPVLEPLKKPAAEIVAGAVVRESPMLGSEPGLNGPGVAAQAPPAPSVRSAVANLPRCEACGFPISEGRRLCLDCEKKKQRAGGPAVNHTAWPAPAATHDRAPRGPAPAVSLDDGPRFLGQQAPESSWLASHKYLVGAIVIAMAGVVVLLLVR
jgi:putative methionine-R-sulfoxide reductase with GAF domain